MYEGARSVIVRDLDPAALVRLIPAERRHPRLPRAGRAAVHADGAGRRRGRLLVARHASSTAPRRSARRCWPRSVATFGARFWQAYGLTETTGAVVNLAPEDHDLDGPEPPPPALVRRRRARRRAAHRRPRDAAPTCPIGDVGEIWVRGPQVMKGYWNNDAATAEAVDADGWFRSGDAGYLDDDGYLYIHDRVKDMIVSGGENVYPAEVENVLMGHDGIADVAVIGVPHEKWGETAKAIVVKARRAGPDAGGDHRLQPASAWPASSARRASTSSTCCRATRAARCSRRTSARRTGRAASARSTEPAGSSTRRLIRT